MWDASVLADFLGLSPMGQWVMSYGLWDMGYGGWQVNEWWIVIELGCLNKKTPGWAGVVVLGSFLGFMGNGSN